MSVLSALAKSASSSSSLSSMPIAAGSSHRNGESLEARREKVSTSRRPATVSGSSQGKYWTETCSAGSVSVRDLEDFAWWAKTISFSSQTDIDCLPNSSFFISSSIVAWLLADSSQKNDKYSCVGLFPFFCSLFATPED